MAKNMPDLINKTGEKLIGGLNAINRSYEKANSKEKKFLNNSKSALLVLQKRYNTLKLKHMTGKFVMDKFEGFKENFLEDPIDDGMLNIPAIAVITGLSGDVISNYKTLSEDVNRIYTNVKKFENGDLDTEIMEQDARGVRLRNSDNTTLPAVLGIGTLVLLGYSAFKKKRGGKK